MERLKTFWHNSRTASIVQGIGLLFFLVYAFFAWYFYQERMLAIDNAAFAFEVLQTKTFFTPLGRWGSVFSQVLPLLCLKMGCSLATFLKVYSVGFILLYYLVFLMITVVLKNPRVGLVYLLTLCLTYRHTFYFAASEFSQGLALVVLLYALLNYFYQPNAKRKWLVLLLSAGLIYVLYFFHQLLFIGVLFVIIITYLKHQDYRKKEPVVLLLFTLFFFGIKIALLPADSYAGSKIPDWNVFITELPHFFNLPSFNYFSKHLRRELLVPMLLLIGGCYLLWKNKKHLLLWAVVGAVLSYLVLIVITYYRGEAPNMYQQYYIMFGLFVAVVIEVSTQKKWKLKTLVLVMLPVLMYSTQRIYATHYLPSMRVTYIKKLAQHGAKYHNKKYIVHISDFPWSYAWVTWAFPVETLLISSLEDKNNAITCYIMSKDDKINIDAYGEQLLCAPWQNHLMHTAVLDTNYFNLPKTSPYLITNQLKK